MKFRVAVLGALVVLAVVLFIALRGGSDSNDNGAQTGTTAEPAAKTIIVKGGKPVGGVQKLEYTVGQTVRFTVESDVADEVHVHGYDLMKDVPAGGSVSFDFPASLEGDFEAELEGRKEQIIDLRVLPK
jgi:hypothetical protein